MAGKGDRLRAACHSIKSIYIVGRYKRKAYTPEFFNETGSFDESEIDMLDVKGISKLAAAPCDLAPGLVCCKTCVLGG